MCGIVTLPRDDHYRSPIATWTHDLCTFIGCLMDKNDKISFDMTYRYGFKHLSIHIARFHSQSRTGGGWGGTYSQDKHYCQYC